MSTKLITPPPDIKERPNVPLGPQDQRPLPNDQLTSEQEKSCSIDATKETIERVAYQKWQQAGCPCCDGVDFWLEAEKEVKAKPKKYA